MPFLNVPPRFWVLLAIAFSAILVWRATRRWWAAYKREVGEGWREGRGTSRR